MVESAGAAPDSAVGVRAFAANSISTTLIGNIRRLYSDALNEVKAGFGVRHGINGYTRFGVSAYILAVAAVEAYLNERFLSQAARLSLPASPLWDINANTVERMKIREKVLLVPKLLLGETFDTGRPPFQDFDLLVNVRNDLVHFKFPYQLPAYVRSLEARKVVLAAVPNSYGADYPWPAKLECTEGIRWAHNTACAMMVGLMDFAARQQSAGAQSLLGFLRPDLHRPSLQPIELTSVRRWFRDNGIDPDSNSP
ncbi:MAG: hypothetical protein AB7R89_19040 [Dehalococcoidia bacterium]